MSVIRSLYNYKYFGDIMHVTVNPLYYYSIASIDTGNCFADISELNQILDNIVY